MPLTPPTAQDQKEALANMHKAFLEALRHREQEILTYLTILGPAFGGFIWLLTYKGTHRTEVFTAGAVGVILTLLLGAVYSLALGYNYRYITLQLAKLESEQCLNIKQYILVSWPRSPQEFKDRCATWCGMPWCGPPEIISSFWKAFVVSIVTVTLTAIVHLCPHSVSLGTVLPPIIVAMVGLASLAIGLAGPIWFGYKLRNLIKEERGIW